MRPFLLSFSLLIILDTFGQRTKIIGTADCISFSDCVTILNDKPIKPFKAPDLYLGRVIIQAKLDTFKMKLTEHKFIFADLYSKVDKMKKIELRPNQQSGDIKYLDKILPDLIKHLRYLKFKIISHKDCNMTTSWNFPIILK
jgi:hypothetical protein